MNKRILSLMLCFAMLAAMMAIAVPMSAAADGEENKVSIELPYKLNVEKTGEMDPPEETFRFAIGDFGAPNEHTIVRDTIDTDGERSYEGMFVFTIDRSLCGNLSEGFAFSQVKGEAEGWTYDETRYYAIPIFTDNNDKVAGWTFFKPDGDERPGQENMVEGIAFTNSYAANKPPEEKVSIELPYKLNVVKTGEMDPPKETFKFAIGDFGAPNEHMIVRDTIETDGERSYEGMFVFTIDRSFCGNLSEGFVFSQVKGEAEGWTYDETRYYAIPNFADNYDKVAGWTFFKLDGDERPGQENMVEELAFTNSYAANKPPEEKVSIELPYRLNVVKTGEMDPPKETFRFAIGDFGAPNEHMIVRDTIDTDGERSYDGMFVFTIDRSFCGNLSEGFVFSQVKGEAEGWTYDETRYYAIPNFADNYDKVAGWTFFKLDGDERPGQENMVEELAFTNSYYAMKPVVPPSDPETPPVPQKPETFTDPETPPAPRKPESPKTSDGGMMELWLALLFVSGISLAGTTLYSRKKRANDR